MDTGNGQDLDYHGKELGVLLEVVSDAEPPVEQLAPDLCPQPSLPGNFVGGGLQPSVTHGPKQRTKPECNFSHASNATLTMPGACDANYIHGFWKWLWRLRVATPATPAHE